MGRTIKKLFKFFAIVGLAVLLFFGRDYVKKYAINRLIGFYYVYKGDRAYHKYKLAYSIEYYLKGLEYFPEHYTAWYNLGNIYVVYEDYYSAVDAYKKAIEHNPKYVLARMNLAIIDAEKLGNFDEAIEQYNSIINLKNKIWAIPFLFNNKKSSKQNIALAYYNMGRAYREKAMFLSDNERELEIGLLRQAADSYEKSHKIMKKNSDVVYNLALTYHIMGSYRDAGINYCKAISLAPMNYEAHYNLAILLRRLKLYKESLNELEKASLLLSWKTKDDDKAAYVYGILSNVSGLYSYELRTSANPDIHNTDNQDVDIKNDKDKKKRKKKKKHTVDDDIIFDYSSGKIIPSKEMDKTMLQNFKMCSGMDYFKHEMDPDAE